MLIVEIIFYGILTGFISRQLAGITDNFLSYTSVFGFIKYKFARLLNKDHVDLASETMPDDYEKYDDYWNLIYNDICKHYKIFRLINCSYCMSYWYCFILMGVYTYCFTWDYLIIYFLISISFNDFFFNL